MCCTVCTHSQFLRPEATKAKQKAVVSAANKENRENQTKKRYAAQFTSLLTRRRGGKNAENKKSGPTKRFVVSSFVNFLLVIRSNAWLPPFKAPHKIQPKLRPRCSKTLRWLLLLIVRSLYDDFCAAPKVPVEAETRKPKTKPKKAKTVVKVKMNASEHAHYLKWVKVGCPLP